MSSLSLQSQVQLNHFCDIYRSWGIHCNSYSLTNLHTQKEITSLQSAQDTAAHLLSTQPAKSFSDEPHHYLESQFVDNSSAITADFQKAFL